MRSLLMILLLQIPLMGCINPKEKEDSNYKRFKSMFEESFTSHFPDDLGTITDPKRLSSTFFKSDTTLHNVCFMLYEYGVSNLEINQIEEKVKGKTIANYQVSDGCLLVVNRFETPEFYQEGKEAKIVDSTLIDLPCYENLYPIPHFLDYKYLAKSGPIWLNKNFTIYVLEANPVNPYKKFAMSPNKQMPAKWQNGYSKGIAISKKDQTVIHWSIMW